MKQLFLFVSLISLLIACGPIPTISPKPSPSPDPSKFGNNITTTPSVKLKENNMSTEDLSGIWLKDTSADPQKTPFILFGANNFDALEQYVNITEPQIKSDLRANDYVLWENAIPVEFGNYEVLYSKFLIFYPKWNVKGVNEALKDPLTKCARFSYTNSQLAILNRVNLNQENASPSPSPSPIDSNTPETTVQSKCQASEKEFSQGLTFYSQPKS